jgi:hypothetical protein
MAQDLRKSIARQTALIVKQYTLIGDSLKQLPASNADLDSFLAHLDSTVAYCQGKFLDAQSINLADCQQRQEPLLLLNSIEQRFNALEQGFFMLYSTPDWGSNIKKRFATTEAAYQRLSHLLGQKA